MSDDKLVDAVAAHTAAVLTEMLLAADEIDTLTYTSPTAGPSDETWGRMCEAAISEGAYTLPLELTGPIEKPPAWLEVCPRCAGTGVVRRGT